MSTTSLSAVVAYMRHLSECDLRQESDRQLLDGFIAGQAESAFAELVRRHGPMVLTTCRRVLRHTQDAEDAFQATFLVLARKAESIRAGESLAGWLHQVAHRLALRARTEACRRPQQGGRAEPFDRAAHSAHDSWHDTLDVELERLPDAYRAPIILCYLEGRSQKEAARLLATSTDAINSRLKRARELLRERLIRHGVALSVAAFAHALATGAADAALSPAAIRAVTHQAVQFALAGDAVPGLAASLARGALRTMLPSKLKIASVLMVAVVALTLGVMFAPASAVGDDPRPAVKASAPAMVAVQEKGGAKKKPMRSCIILWMSGGPSQIDTFDPKKGDIALYKPIDTNVKGMQFSEKFPLLAKQANHLAVVRSMTHRSGDHARGTYLMHTGVEPAANVIHPALGSVLAKELGDDRPDLPRFFMINGKDVINAKDVGPGFLGKEYAAIPVKAVDDNLLPPVDAFEDVAKGKGEKHRQAVAKAFDLTDEKDAMRNAYGLNRFGQGCLLARRLVERGVPVVEVSMGGWDAHGNAVGFTNNAGPELDAAFAALLKDLHDRKKLDSTLIVWMGEFGRTPRINANAGRDHYPLAFTTVLAGCGIKGGQAIGKTTADGVKVEERPVSPPEFLATIYQALGVDPAKTNTLPGGEKVPLVEKGNAPVKEALR